MTELRDAVAAVGAGRVCVIPTDTVYGVAASLTVPGAIDRLFALKGRPRDKPLPVLGGDAASLEDVVSFDEPARRLAERFWPGPLTIVLPRSRGFTVDLGGEGTTVAVRVPAHRIALELIRATGPLAVTSANRSGAPPFTTAAEAVAEFGDDVCVLDGGTCDGAPSTIVSLAPTPIFLREGGVSAEAVLAELAG